MTIEEKIKLNIAFPDGKLDVLEQGLLEYDAILLQRLMKDKTTDENIKWGTNDYKDNGVDFLAHSEMKASLVTGPYSRIIQPRASKPSKEQTRRTRKKGEVFTPSWVCNKQNNKIDEAWFEKSEVFNKETSNGWITTKNKIVFPNVKGKTWQDYVEAVRIEITCGEAPYLVSRYDTVTGEMIPVNSRIGLLDRKLRIVDENTKTAEEWIQWTTVAFQSVYGYDYQGDNVLLARENLLYTFADYYIEKFKKEPPKDDLRKIANIISWNIWQMDGFTMSCPYTHVEKPVQITMDMLLSPEKTTTSENAQISEEGIPCRIMDWKAKKSIEFKSLIKEK